MIETQYITLDMKPSGVLPVLYCSQYDIGRPLGMVVYNGGEVVDLGDYSVTIEATRTDGVAITAAVTTDGNVGAFETTATMTNQADRYGAQLVLSAFGKRVASLPFVMCVVKAAMDENAESIEEDASLYQQYTETVQTLIANIHYDINGLNNSINNEAAAREAGDAAEATARAEAISAEAAARAEAVSAEAAAREAQIAALQSAVGSPLTASTVAAMTDHTKIYVYTGSETGYTAGNWYYWAGNGWVSGGVYNSTAFETDKTLTVIDSAADAKVTGDNVRFVRSYIDEHTETNYLVNEPVFIAQADHLGSWTSVAYEYPITKSRYLYISCDSVEYDGSHAPSNIMRVERYNGSTRLAYGDITFASLPRLIQLESNTDKIIVRININMAAPVTNMKATLYNYKLINGDIGIDTIKNEYLGKDVLIPKGTYTVTTNKSSWTSKMWDFCNVKHAKGVRVRRKSLTYSDTPLATNGMNIAFYTTNSFVTDNQIANYYIHGVYDYDRIFEMPSNTKAIRVEVRTNAATALNTSVVVEDFEVTLVGADGVEDRLTVLDGDYKLPDYYFTNGYLTNKANAIKQLMYDAEGQYDSAIFITDIHWEDNALNSPALIRWLVNHTNIQKLFFGGDLYNGWAPDTTTDSYSQLSKAFGRPKDTYMCIGNHEFNHVGSGWSGGGLTEAKCWYLFNSMHDNIVPGDPARNYYYFDNDIQKIRYIFLSVFTDKGAGEQQAALLFEQEQQDWFEDVALGTMTAGWGAVVITHCVYEINAVTSEIYQDSFTVPLTDIVDAYDGPGEIICVIQGHSHRDRIVNTAGGTKVVITTCDKCRSYSVPGETPAIDLDVDRTRGTINEQAFDVFIFDRKNRRVSAVRIGAGARNGIGNDPGQQVEVRQFTY